MGKATEAVKKKAEAITGMLHPGGKTGKNTKQPQSARDTRSRRPASTNRTAGSTGKSAARTPTGREAQTPRPGNAASTARKTQKAEESHTGYRARIAEELRNPMAKARAEQAVRNTRAGSEKTVPTVSRGKGAKTNGAASAPSAQKKPTGTASYRQAIAEYIQTPKGKARISGALSEQKNGKKTSVLSFFGAPVGEKSPNEIVQLVRSGEMTEAKDGTFRYTLRGEAIRRDLADGSRTPDTAVSTARFLWPVEGGRITSHFGPRKSFRTKNGAWSSSNHPSIDIGAPEGTPIRSVAGGTVSFAGFVKGYGYTVEVTHADGSVAKYHHMQSPTPFKVGEKVAQGARVGAVGETGNATGPHLDISLVIDGKTVDPEVYLGKATEQRVTPGKKGTRTALLEAAYDAYTKREIAAGREPLLIVGMNGEGTPSDRLLAMANQEAGEEPLMPVVKTASAKTPTLVSQTTARTGNTSRRAAAPKSPGGEQQKETINIRALEGQSELWDRNAAAFLEEAVNRAGKGYWDGDAQTYLSSMLRKGGLLVAASKLLADKIAAHPERYGKNAVQEAQEKAKLFAESYGEIKDYFQREADFFGQFKDQADYESTMHFADLTERAEKTAEIGQFGKGNIDLYALPQSGQKSGAVKTMVVEEDGKQVLIPTVIPAHGGRIWKEVSEEDAVSEYEKTGRYFGKFDTKEEALAYADELESAHDFYVGSRYRTTANGKEPRYALSGYMTETGFDDIIYDYINGNQKARVAQAANDINTNMSFLGMDQSDLQQMTSEEVMVYNYLYHTEGAESAENYRNSIKKVLNYRQRKEKETEAAQFAENHPAVASTLSILASPLKGIAYMGQYGDYLEDGEIDSNAGYNHFSYRNSATRRAVSEKIAESGKWGKAGSIAYHWGMGMADFLYATAITGGNEWMTLGILGSGAAADTVIDGMDRGLSSRQAFTLGTVAGAVEAATEKIGFDALFKTNANKTGLVRYILKNMAAEGSEEGLADIANLTADILISKDKSEWQRSIRAYQAQGKSEGEALGLAVADQAEEIGLDVLGGILSGGILSGARTGGSTVADYISGNADENTVSLTENKPAGVENSENGDIIIGKSVGAKAQNYDVMDLDTGEVYPLAEGSKIQNVEIFAGAGTRTRFRKAEKFAADYGGNPRQWQHVKGFGVVVTEDGNRFVEIHWSQCPGIGKYEFFIKKWLD